MLVIDKREKSAELIDMILSRAEIEHIEVSFENLTVGDFLYNDQICIEHKTTTDFVQSLNSGHLDTQVLDLQQYPCAYLFINGAWSYHFNPRYSQRFTAKSKVGKISSILARTTVKVQEFKNESELVDGIFAVIRKTDEGEKVFAVQRHTKTLNQDPNLAMYLGLPGLGTKRAQVVMARYPRFSVFLEAYKTHGKVDVSLPKKTKEYLDKL